LLFVKLLLSLSAKGVRISLIVKQLGRTNPLPVALPDRSAPAPHDRPAFAALRDFWKREPHRGGKEKKNSMVFVLNAPTPR
jgi:hypothetical protein